MALEVWYPADILNALRAAEHAANATAAATGHQNDAFAAGFLTGCRAVLTTLALAFGLAARSDDRTAFDSEIENYRYSTVTLLTGLR